MPKVKKHKRKGPKSTRAGCLMCKPEKRQGVVDTKRSIVRAKSDAKQQAEEEGLPINFKGRVR